MSEEMTETRKGLSIILILVKCKYGILMFCFLTPKRKSFVIYVLDLYRELN